MAGAAEVKKDKAVLEEQHNRCLKELKKADAEIIKLTATKDKYWNMSTD